MRIINESRVNFQYRNSSDSPIIAKTEVSNRVTTEIIQDTLLVKKFVDKSIAAVYEILLYTLEITNITNSKVKNILVKDIISQGVRYINNTLHINGDMKRCLNPQKGIFIEEIQPNEKIIVNFKMVIDKTTASNLIMNLCNVTFDYIYNIEKPPIEVMVDSNEVKTVKKDDIFKQFLVNSKFNINKCGKKISSIIWISSKVTIIENKIINCLVKANMRNLIVTGFIKYKIYYVSRGKLLSCVWNEGFSNTLIVPKGIEFFEKQDIKVKAKVESTNYILIDKCKLFIATSILIKL